jgi:Tfp pilus assembly protein PilX
MEARMDLMSPIRDERGIALAVALLVSLVVAAITVGAAMLATNAAMINRFNDRLSTLEAAAESGVEEARSTVNGDKTLYPDSGYNVIENGVSITDASGATIPGVSRYTYVGPTGVTTGQYGVFGSIVSVAEPGGKAR